MRRDITVTIRPKGKAPLGLRVDMNYYWARKLCEQVFGYIAKRRRILYAKTVERAIVLPLLLLASHNLAVLWRSAKLLDMFACI
ncbi:MAG: hypothetical protein DRJ32_00235 [Thermoprotei archaeon]|nr:MAG: hypothetical protein DRJ32_00235 [Thermoprotei archaeon]